MKGKIPQQEDAHRAPAQPFLTPATQHVRPLPFFQQALAGLIR